MLSNFDFQVEAGKRLWISGFILASLNFVFLCVHGRRVGDRGRQPMSLASQPQQVSNTNLELLSRIPNLKFSFLNLYIFLKRIGVGGGNFLHRNILPSCKLYDCLHRNLFFFV